MIKSRKLADSCSSQGDNSPHILKYTEALFPENWTISISDCSVRGGAWMPKGD